MNKEKIDERFTLLWERAVSRMLEKTDTDIREWLNSEESLEYNVLNEWLGTTDNLRDIANTVGADVATVRGILESVDTL